jgi:hypothetical protein
MILREHPAVLRYQMRKLFLLLVSAAAVAYPQNNSPAASITFGGTTSGTSATVGVPANAGTPAPILFPIATGAANGVWQTDGNSPQQTSWQATSGTGNIARVNGPAFGAMTAATLNKVNITQPATGSTLTIPDGVTLTGPSASGTVATLGNTNTFTGRQDSSGAASTAPFKVGNIAGLPGICATGDLYFATDATAGQQIYECNSNVWTQQLNSGAAGAVVNTLRVCTIDNDSQSATVLTAAQFGGRCKIPAAATIVEVTVVGGTGTITGTPANPTVTGTSSIQIGKFSPNSGTTNNALLSGALATATGKACAMSSRSGTCIDGSTSSGTISISTTALSAGDVVYVSAATADGVQTWYQTTITYTIN